MTRVIPPLRFAELFFPHVYFYNKQKEILQSLFENDETIVIAGNMLGKDFVTAFAVLYFFLTRHPCRIVTTSADYDQLEAVLWGEIRRFINESKIPMTVDKGGNLVVNHLHIRKIVNGKLCGLSYILGRVAKKGEGLLGHHIADTGDGIPRTLIVGDEASGIEDVVYDRTSTWSNRRLFIGNPYPCNNFFNRADKEGDLQREDGNGYYRKVIYINGKDSPNVRLALGQIERGETVTKEIIVPGVLPYDVYEYRVNNWDEIRRTVSIDGKFYRGKEVMMFPEEWLMKSAKRILDLRVSDRKAKYLGIDPAEGGDKTVFCLIDDFGIIKLESILTPDTSIIPEIITRYIVDYRLNPRDVYIDRGGGGIQHAHYLRRKGYKIKSVGFGETVSIEPKHGRVMVNEKVIQREEKSTYKNRRAQMYDMIRQAINPNGEKKFCIPKKYSELRRQLSLIPLTYNGEGQLYLLPKNKNNPNDTRKTLIDIIGHSPDEADALALAVYGMMKGEFRVRASTY